MDKKTIGDWIMYHEVQRLLREGLSFTAIGKALVIDRRTVKRYSRMSEAGYPTHSALLIAKRFHRQNLRGVPRRIKRREKAHGNRDGRNP